MLRSVRQAREDDKGWVREAAEIWLSLPLLYTHITSTIIIVLVIDGAGDWQVTSSAAGQVDFRLKNGKMTVRSGTVAVAVGNDRTEIKVDVYP